MFFILHEDKSIYEYFFNQTQQPIKQIFLVHSALDTIDYTIQKKRDYYLGQIKNQELLLFAYVNPNLIRFVLVLNSQFKKQIDKKVDSTIRQFFIKVNQQLALAMLNPLYRVNHPIISKNFDEKLKSLIRDYLKMFISDKDKRK